MKRAITQFNTPVLRQKGERIAAVTPEVRKLVEDMLDTMHEARGIGLAAQQVGLARQLCIVEVPAEMDQDEAGHRLNPDLAMPMVVMNPEILSVSDRNWDYEEGCLSFPEITGRIRRPWGIRLRYLALDGQTREIDAQGLVARALQHEIDHLNGVLFIDRMSNVRRVSLSGKLKRLSRQTEAGG